MYSFPTGQFPEPLRVIFIYPIPRVTDFGFFPPKIKRNVHKQMELQSVYEAKLHTFVGFDVNHHEPVKYTQI